MFRRFATRLAAVLTPADDFAAALNVYAIEAAGSNERSVVTQEARTYARSVTVDPATISLPVCVEAFQHCADFNVPTDARCVQLLGLWFDEHVAEFSDSEMASISAAVSTSPTQLSFWDGVAFKKNEVALCQAVQRMSDASIIHFVETIRGVLPDDHFLLQAAFARCQRGVEFVRVLAAFGPIGPYRRQLSAQCLSAVQNSSGSDLVNLVVAITASGVGDPALLNACANAVANDKGPNVSETALVQVVERLLRHGAAMEEPPMQRLVERTLQSMTELDVAADLVDTLHASADLADEPLLLKVCEAAQRLPCTTLIQRCQLAKCEAAAGHVDAVKSFFATLKGASADLGVEEVTSILEVAVVADVFPGEPLMRKLLSQIHTLRDAAAPGDIAMTLFATAMSKINADDLVDDLISTASSRCRMQKAADVLHATVVGLLLRAIHLLDRIDSQPKFVEFLLERAQNAQHTYTISECCHLLVVTRSIGPAANALTVALANQVHASIPLLHPSHIALIANTLAVCHLRDIAVFEALAQRAQTCAGALSESQVLDLLSAYENVSLETVISTDVLRALCSGLAKNASTDAKVELLLWGYRKGCDLGIEVPRDQQLPSTLAALIDHLTIAPTAASLEKAIAMTESLSAAELAVNIRPKRLVTAMAAIARATLPDQATSTLLHRLALASTHLPSEELVIAVDAMVTTLVHLAARKLCVGSIFRVFGGKIAASSSRLTPAQCLEVLEAYASMSIVDDSVVRVLMQRLAESRRVVEKSPALAGRYANLKTHFAAWTV